MTFIELIRSESDDSGLKIGLYALATGLSNGALLVIINVSAASAGYGKLNIQYMLLFALALSIFLLSKRKALKDATVLSENAINKVQLRLVDKVRRSNLSLVEKVGQSEIYTRVTQDTIIISQAVMVVVNAFQCSLMLVFCFMYLAYLSWVAFFITTFLIATGLSVYVFTQKEIKSKLEKAAAKS